MRSPSAAVVVVTAAVVVAGFMEVVARTVGEAFTAVVPMEAGAFVAMRADSAAAKERFAVGALRVAAVAVTRAAVGPKAAAA
ncbi:MAG: hypothetical protein WBD45_10010 [Terriglobales bacterium]